MSNDRSITFLHGFLGTANDWRSVASAPEFADWASHPTDLPAASDWKCGVDAVADGLANNTILVGYSMGARAALGVAMDTTVSLSGLVLISGSPGIEDAERSARAQHDSAISQQLLELSSLDQQDQKRAFLREWYRQPVFSSLTDDQITELVRYRGPFDPQRQSRLLETYSVSRQPNYWPRLSELKIPALVIAGEHDSKYVDVAKRMAQAYPAAELTVIADAGHNVERENPTAFVERLARFCLEVEK